MKKHCTPTTAWADAEAVRISGLELKCAYLDNTDANNAEKRQDSAISCFTGQTDRAYQDTTHAVEIAGSRSAPIASGLVKESSRTTVVWNPWIEGAHSLADLGDDEWRSMACVEGSNIRAFAVELAAGQQHTMKTTLTVLDSADPGH